MQEMTDKNIAGGGRGEGEGGYYADACIVLWWMAGYSKGTASIGMSTNDIVQN